MKYRFTYGYLAQLVLLTVVQKKHNLRECATEEGRDNGTCSIWNGIRYITWEKTMYTHRRFIVILVIVGLMGFSVQSFAAIINVPADQPTIQSGIDAARNGDTVIVADGTYKGEGNVNLDFKGKQITVKSQNGAKSTIINCLWTPDTRGFIFQNEETHDSVLDGFTIKNGRDEFGGGIYCKYASPTIKNCIIARNKAIETEFGTGHGGGIYCYSSDARIISSTISNNIADSTYGGGVYFDGDDKFVETGFPKTYRPSVINCTISDNRGSGVHILSDAAPEIKFSKILHNSWRGVKCTFFSRGGTVITNCEIAQNTGGGVDVSEYAILKIEDSIIKQNTATSGAGILCSPSGNIEVSDCIIVENIATRWGGGIAVLESKWGDVKMTKCTIARNFARERGGGLYIWVNTSFSLTDSIVWGNNSDGTHAEIYVSGRGIVLKSNDIRDGIDGIGIEPDGLWFIYEDNIDEDPLFLDADRGDYRLKFTSPAKRMGADSPIDITYSVSSVGKKLVSWGEIKRR